MGAAYSAHRSTRRRVPKQEFWSASEDGASCQRCYSFRQRKAGTGSAEAQRAIANGARIEAWRAGEARAQIEGQSREC